MFEYMALLHTMYHKIFKLEVYDLAVATVKWLFFAFLIFYKHKIVPTL